MIIPPYLQPGDTIGITCPSGYLPKERVITAKEALERAGYQVLLGRTVGTEHFYFSDNDDRRCYDLQQMLDNPEVKAILMGRGGYGLSRIIDRLNFEKFVQRPKWICGFSDITVLHSHIARQWGIATLHSPMCGAFRDDVDQAIHLNSFFQTLKGAYPEYPIEVNPYNRAGHAEGVLVGGNLAMLAHLSGSVSQQVTEGKILFLEDIGEYLYNIDRMLLNLKRAGMLNQLAGLVCGGFTDVQDTERPFGQNIYEIIRDKVEAYDPGPPAPLGGGTAISTFQPHTLKYQGVSIREFSTIVHHRFCLLD
jgi:muramoyltetrapeptide carboxypeptidase